MTLPVHYAKLDEVTLDDLKFQDLVDEGRKRIRQYCPDWTEYNLSDPGITLLELFAWMTELTVYRLNQVPHKNYIKFLEMLGYGLLPAKAATTELTFRLAAPFPINPDNQDENLITTIPKGREVSTGAHTREPISFTTDYELVIRTAEIKYLRSGHDRTFTSENRWPLRTNDERIDRFTVFTSINPEMNSAFYIGISERKNEPHQSRLQGHVLRLTIRCAQTSDASGDSSSDQKGASGLNPDDPPLTWEYCVTDTDSLAAGSEDWRELETGKAGEDRDSTGGLYYKEGSVTLFLPTDIEPRKLLGQTAIWIRCRYDVSRTRDSENRYSISPVIEQIRLQTIGASIQATNCKQADEEFLGVSTGEPGQVFRLKHSPILEVVNESALEASQFKVVVKPEANRTERQNIEYIPRTTFAFSDKHTPHVVVNVSSGEVHFGPSIRQQNGTMRQYGRVPPVSSRIYAEGYSYHAGASGNVAVERIRVMHQSIPYVDSVLNRKAVINGQDPETVEEAILRAQREMRAQQRAVSASDFEIITLNKFGAKQLSSDGQGISNTFPIVRVKCLTPDDLMENSHNGKNAVAAGMIDILVIPPITNPSQAAYWEGLQILPSQAAILQAHLQKYCLIARSVNVRTPYYVAVKVAISVKPYWASDSQRDKNLEKQIERFLYRYYSPVPYGKQESEPSLDLPEIVRSETWQGWNFGEPIHEDRLRGLLREIPGIQYIEKLEISCADLGILTRKESWESKLQSFKLITNTKDIVVSQRADLILCSYRHEVAIHRPN